MTSTDQSLLTDPRVQELLALRRRRYLGLSAVVTIVYALVAIGCAFAPALMRQPIAGTHVSLGIASMAFVIVVAIVCSGYYAWWSNTVRDPLTQRLLKDITAERP